MPRASTTWVRKMFKEFFFMPFHVQFEYLRARTRLCVCALNKIVNCADWWLMTVHVIACVSILHYDDDGVIHSVASSISCVSHSTYCHYTPAHTHKSVSQLQFHYQQTKSNAKKSMQCLLNDSDDRRAKESKNHITTAHHVFDSMLIDKWVFAWNA